MAVDTSGATGLPAGDPGDTLGFSAILTGNWACRRSECLDIEESFSGGGTYR
ncbi:hypothetical protein ACIQFZ_30955 [Streptomyces sp. NPDC093064]|uniref:hypothetical protein n=1 Tax=Streptomyces sp. NPDC093064 TaxID=3366020 RepID=UPI0037FB1792